MRARGWSKLKLAKELGVPENSVRRLLDLRHSSHMWVIDEALAKMNAELSIDLPKAKAGPQGGLKNQANLQKTGAGEGIRTLDPDLGKVVLYP